ncbi:MAG: aldo/keto reductase [Acaryochloris sp. RU_4_1]|nr:aldo/keto reductase [Acaryochloris sp. RU_4_1]NJR57331.1 aldo/keto reductase [Acaryochloris sp. CRU_2_0]
MDTKKLGPDGPEVSALGLGTWSWGDRWYWGYGDQYGESEVEAAFQTAVDAGITFFDTAEIYGGGEAERLLGKFRQQIQTPIQICAKYVPFPWRVQSQAINAAVQGSLNRLQVNCIDLYQVLVPFNFLISQRTLFQTLATEVQAGRIKAVGVCNYNVEQMHQAHQLLAEFGIPLVANQVRYSLITRQVERQGILAAAKQLGVTVMANSPLAQGFLTGKYSPDQPPKGVRALDSRFRRANFEKRFPVIDLLRQFGKTHGRTMAQVALNWLIAQDIIPIPGAKTAKQARENAGALGWSLTPDEIAALEAASRPWL